MVHTGIHAAFLTVLLLVAGCEAFEIGEKTKKPVAVEVNPAFPGQFGPAVDRFLTVMAAPKKELSAFSETGDRLLAVADLESGTARMLGARFLAGECYVRSLRWADAHDCYGEILRLDRDAGHLEKVFRGASRSGADKKMPAVVKAVFPQPGNLGRLLFHHLVRRETEIAFKFLGGEKRSFLGLKVVGSRSLGAEILEKTTQLAPYGPLAAQSLYEIGNYHGSDGNLEKAIFTYERLIREHPENRWRPAAEYMVARSYYRMNTDISRDTVNLTRALMRFKIFLQNNPDLKPLVIGAGAKVDLRVNAKQYVSLIRGLLAEKSFRIAKWYLGKGKAAAARVYLATILKDYPDTSWAGEAKSLMAEHPAEEAK